MKSKKSIVFASATMLLASAVPLVAVSCGGTIQKPRTVSEGDFAFPGSGSSSLSGDAIQSRYEDIFLNGQVPQGWGVQTDWDYQSNDKMPAEWRDRRSTGMPKSPTTDGRNIWYWSPEHTADGTMAPDDFRNTSREGLNGIPSFPYQYAWQNADGDFNRATIRDVQPRTMGEKIKPTQSAWARYDNLTNFTTENANNSMSTQANTVGGPNTLVTSWEYNTTAMAWGGGGASEYKMPSGAAIDAAHRNGTPIFGTVFMWMTEPGPTIAKYLTTEFPAGSGEYPGMRGIVEMADFYGFDGWFLDWEGSGSTTPALQALLRYAHSTDPDLPNPALGKTVEEQKAVRAKYGYKHRPQAISNYWNNTGANSDIFLAQQMHGRESESSVWGKMQMANNSWDRDWLAANGATSPGEDGPDAARLAYGTLYESGLKAARAHMPQFANDHSKVDTSDYPASATGTGNTDWERMTTQGRASENMFSTWNYSYSIMHENVNVNERFHSGESGDPRHIDSKEKWSISNSVQERTPIVGRKNFTSNFDYGNGKVFNMWGYNDMNPYMALSSESSGWKDQSLQDVLPTYRWIIDEYNSANVRTSDYIHLDSNGHVQRHINPILDNKTNSAWFGGTTLKYTGALQNVGDYFVNKLYASNVKLENGDKMELIVKNDGPTPDLALWTSDKEVDPMQTFNVKEAADQQWGQKMGWYDGPHTQGRDNDVPKWFEYYEESTWKGVERTQRFISPTSTEKIGDSGWSKVTYDLSSLAGKSMMDFGIKVTATEPNQDMSNLQLGQISFKTAGSQTKPVMISNVKTQHVWDTPSIDSARARITWDASDRVRNYFTFLADENGKPYNLVWTGANPSAYISQIPHGATSQNVVVVGVDDDFNMVTNQLINVALKPTNGGN